MTFCFRFSIASALSLESILLRQSSHLHRDVQTPLLWKHLQYDFKHWLCLQLQNYPLSANRRAFFIWMQVSQHDYFKHISVLAKKQGHSIPLQVGKQSQLWLRDLPSFDALLSCSMSVFLLLSKELRFQSILCMFE